MVTLLVVLGWLAKGASIVLMFFLAFFMGGLYKVMIKFPQKSDERGWIAWGIMAEFVLFVQLVVYVITG